MSDDRSTVKKLTWFFGRICYHLKDLPQQLALFYRSKRGVVIVHAYDTHDLGFKSLSIVFFFSCRASFKSYFDEFDLYHIIPRDIPARE